MITFLLLGLSILLSTGRNLFSKKLSNIPFGTKGFFICQSILFLSGSCAIILFGKISIHTVALSTWLYAIIYALLLILAQWFYTAALFKGNTALCSTVYSLGFIFPTLSGAIFWSEQFSLPDLLGILCAISAVVISGYSPQTKKAPARTSYFIPLVIAMLASGGLGIVQKMQQMSAHAEQKSTFLLIAFLISTGISLIFTLISKKQSVAQTNRTTFLLPVCIGLFFGCCNLLNTSLAGQLDSAIFFPTLNIGVILLSLICGVIFFKEKIKRRDTYILILGIVSILLLNLG